MGMINRGRPGATLPRLLGVLVLLLCGLTALPAPGAQPAPVTLKSEVLLTSDLLRLGDLFTGLGAAGDTAIAHAPAPGESVVVDATWLAAIARRHGIAWAPDSHLIRARIGRAGQRIAGETVLAQLAAELRFAADHEDLEIRLDQPAPSLVLPLEDTAGGIALQGLSYDPASGRFVAEVVAPAEGTPLVRKRVSGRAWAMVEVPALARPLARGAVIGVADLTTIRVRADRLDARALRYEEDLLGKSPRRRLTPGRVVLAKDLGAPLLVTRNSLVTVVLVRGSLVLTTRGRALDAGGEGEAVRVMNTGSRKIIEGVVGAADLVRVELPAPTAHRQLAGGTGS